MILFLFVNQSYYLSLFQWDSLSYSQKKYEIFTNKSCAPYTLQSSDGKCLAGIYKLPLFSFLLYLKAACIAFKSRLKKC